jgi:hypothetical protein
MELIKNKGWRGAGIVAIALLFASGIAFGQAQTGNIFAKAADDNGAALPGVSVTLSGAGAPLSQVTNVNGEVRFLNLPPATYSLDFSLQGFAKVTRKNIVVSVGQNSQINVTMKLAGVQESVVVTGESPLLDTRKTGAGAVVDKVQLEDVPSARDPWVILQTAPGISIDRVNVGGSESGQQSVYVGKGDNGFQGTWNVDGVNITDMGALGSSPAYYDFDSFAEIQVQTGGSDVAIQTPGAQLNMVTKRGTNDVHGSARVLITDRKTQSTNISEELANQLAAAGQSVQGNQIQNIQDYGVELGGPLWKDHLWLWGAYGRNQIDLLTSAGYPDRTKLEDLNFKLNAQIVPENTLTAVYNHNDKIKLGRNASPTRPPETAWNQTGPGKIYKIEDSHIFGSDFFATASYSRVMGGFQFDTDGQTQAFQDAGGVWHNSFYHYDTYRPQTQVTVTPSYFLRTGNVGHEFKAGFIYRTTPVGSQSSWPQGIIGWAPDAYLEGQGLAAFVRDSNRQTEQKYYTGYLQDTMTIDKLTVNVGVRYDHQQSWNVALNVPCCRYSTTDWPQVPFTPLSVGASDKLTWDDWAPRVGLTYSLNDGKTLVKASYSRFINQLGGGTSSWNSAAPIGPSYLYYYWNDNNHNNRVDPGEVDFTTDRGYGPNGIYSGWYVDPNVPNPTTALNRNDPNMTAPKTDEFILGVEHEVLPAFVVGLSGTYRKFTNFTGTQPLSADGSRILTSADYTCTQVGPYPQTPGGTPEYVNECNPNPGVASESRILTNVPGYNQQYWGIDLTATKRYSDKWMARFAFTWSDWKQHNTGDIADPSSLRPGATNDIVGYGNVDGGIVVVSPGAISGAKAQVFINSRWQGTLSGMYTLPLDFNISTSLFAREGYPVPYYYQIGASGVPAYATPKQYLLGNVDDVRLPSVFEWDLGLSKVVKVGPLDVTLMADVFNVLNRNTVLQRQNRVRFLSDGSENPANNDILEQQSPRIWRFGARLSF